MRWLFCLNCPIWNKNIQVKDYDFPTIYAVSENEIFSKWNFNYVPYCIILKNNKIRYTGVFRIDNDTIVGNTENEIEKLLNQ